MSKISIEIGIEEGTPAHEISRVLRELEELGYSITIKKYSGFIGEKDTNFHTPVKLPEAPKETIEESKQVKPKRPYKKGKGKFNKTEYQREYRKRKAEEKKKIAKKQRKNQATK